MARPLKAGDAVAAKLCLERRPPRRQSRPLILDLPPTEDATGIAAAIETVFRAAGAIDLDEALSCVGLLQAKANVPQADELEQRPTAHEAAHGTTA